MGRYSQNKDLVQKVAFAKLKKAIISGVSLDQFIKMMDKAKECSFTAFTNGDGYDSDNNFHKNCTLLTFAYLDGRFDIAEYLLDSGAYGDVCGLLSDDARLNYCKDEKLKQIGKRIEFLMNYINAHPEIKERLGGDLSHSMSYLLQGILDVQDSRFKIRLSELMLKSGVRVDIFTWRNLIGGILTNKIDDSVERALLNDYQRLTDLFISYGGIKGNKVVYGHVVNEEIPVLKEILSYMAHMAQSARPFIRPLSTSFSTSFGKTIDNRKEAISRLLSKMACYTIEKFYEAGADINKADSDGETALHVACSSVMKFQDGTLSGFDVVTKLLSYGADIDAIDSVGDTPVEKIKIEGDWGKTREYMRQVAGKIQEHRREVELADRYDELEYAR